MQGFIDADDPDGSCAALVTMMLRSSCSRSGSTRQQALVLSQVVLSFGIH